MGVNVFAPPKREGHKNPFVDDACDGHSNPFAAEDCGDSENPFAADVDTQSPAVANGKIAPDSAAMYVQVSAQHSEELIRLREALAIEEAACAAAREEVEEARRVSREACGGSSGSRSKVVQESSADDVDHLRVALSEEIAKSRRLGEHGLRAEQSRRRLLHELAEEVNAEDDLIELAKVVGRAARAISTISRHAPQLAQLEGRNSDGLAVGASV